MFIIISCFFHISFLFCGAIRGQGRRGRCFLYLGCVSWYFFMFVGFHFDLRIIRRALLQCTEALCLPISAGTNWRARRERERRQWFTSIIHFFLLFRRYCYQLLLLLTKVGRVNIFPCMYLNVLALYIQINMPGGDLSWSQQ